MPLSGTWRLGRRAAVVALAAALLAALAAVAAPRGEPARAGVAEKRPNIVVVMTDDQESGSLRVMKQTRRLLVRKGVKFTRFYTSFPLCCPSRATYLTGQYAHNHGVRGNRPPDGGYLALNDAETTPVALNLGGYRTGYVGKFLNGYPNYGRNNPKDVPDGFDRWLGQLTGRLYNFFTVDDGRIRLFERSRRNYQTDVYARQGRRFIRHAVKLGAPFFLTVATLPPHGEPKRKEFPNPRPAPRHEGAFAREPLPKPPSFNEADVSDKPRFIQERPRIGPEARRALRERYRSRLASLLAVDDLVAGLVAELRSTGQLANTYIVFTSDNGYTLGEHRLKGKTALYEPSAKVPLVIRGPGLPRGAVRDQPTVNVDLAATFHQISGIEPLVPLDGLSLLPVALDPEAGEGREILLENRRAAGVADGRYVYIEHDYDDNGTDEYELYDLERDPYELENLHLLDAPAVRPEVLAKRPELAAKRNQLADRLDELRDCAGTSGPGGCQ